MLNRYLTKASGFSKKGSMKTPVIELSDCILCGVCVDACPEIFQINETAGFVSVADLPSYPESEVDEVIMYCPADCISWGESK